MDIRIKEMNIALSRINSLYSKWQEDMNVSGARQQIVLALVAEPGISQKEICTNYLLPKQTVSKEILLMEKEGLLTLEVDENDRRGKKIVMTERGIEYTNQVLQPYFNLESRIENRMQTEHYEQLVTELVNYANALENELEENKKG
ncbi:MarR family winged helix-turn-helix transcriptional regulator [Intestinibacter sp.]|uniref:MarR family winged helix-turn-helix transcriptional regulator n=1 Tax=Intestinibacter sp. TaxID=1965304 RepID=UPI003F163FAB